MTVYELIQKLTKYRADADIRFKVAVGEAEYEIADVNFVGDTVTVPDSVIDVDFDCIDKSRCGDIIINLYE